MFVLVAMLLFPTGAFAAENNVPMTPPPVEVLPKSIQSTLFLKVWSTTITQKSGTSIQVTGDTEAYEDVDTIEVKLYLQYWDGTQWLDSTYIKTYSDTFSNYVYGAANLTVQSGYYYRTKGIHYVNKSGSVEQVTSYSSSIYIS